MAGNEAPTARRQRADHAAENAQDYVELIDDLQREIGAAHKSDIAARLGVSHVTVHKTVKRLKTLGLVVAEAHRAVSLTPKGKELADTVRERHRLVIRFLLHLGVPRAAAEDDSEGLEHHLSAETERAMVRFCAAMEKDGQWVRAKSKIAKGS